jgi:hypothetical protein
MKTASGHHPRFERIHVEVSNEHSSSMASAILLFHYPSRKFRAFDRLALIGPMNFAREMNRRKYQFGAGRKRKSSNGDSITFEQGSKKLSRESRKDVNGAANGKGNMETTTARVECLKGNDWIDVALSEHHDVDSFDIRQLRNDVGQWLAINVPEQESGAWQR